MVNILFFSSLFNPFPTYIIYLEYAMCLFKKLDMDNFKYTFGVIRITFVMGADDAFFSSSSSVRDMRD